MGHDGLYQQMYWDRDSRLVPASPWLSAVSCGYISRLCIFSLCFKVNKVGKHYLDWTWVLDSAHSFRVGISKLWPIHVRINLVSLEHSHAHSSVCCLQLLSCYSGSVGLRSLKYLLSGPSQKKIANPWSRGVICLFVCLYQQNPSKIIGLGPLSKMDWCGSSWRDRGSTAPAPLWNTRLQGFMSWVWGSLL